MNQEQIAEFISNGKFDVVVDTTHPFAKEITYNIQAALKRNGADWNINSIFEVEKRRHYGEGKRHYLF